MGEGSGISAWRSRLQSWLSRSSIVLFALLLMSIGGAFLIWNVYRDRAVTLDIAHQQLAPLAKGFGLQIESMVADGVGSAIAGARQLRPDQNAATVEQMLVRLLNGGDSTRALFVLRNDELLVANRLGEQLSPRTAPWREQLARATGPVWVGQVMESPAGEGLVLPFARRAMGVDGMQLWAGALLGFGELEETYADLGSTGTRVALVTLDGILLRRLPARADDATNLDIHGSEALQRFFAQPLRTTTLLRAPQPDSGTPYLYAAYRLKDLPMVATAGIAVADALEPWRARRAVAWEFLILTTLVVMILALALQRLYNRRWQSLQQLADARRVELETHEMLARQLLLAQEAERKRLASELHDGVGQGLSLLRNRIVLLRRTGLSPDADGHAQALLDHATESISDLRGVVQALRPMHLEELGPTSALNALVERVRVSSGLEVHHHIENVDDVVGGTAATHLYRIAQEAINNVLKHAGAKHLWVDVIRDINLVELSVRDDGRGLGQLAQRGIDRSAGLGLLSIAERCHILGAELLLQANEPAGTWLRVRLPIEAELGRVAAEAGADGA